MMTGWKRFLLDIHVRVAVMFSWGCYYFIGKQLEDRNIVSENHNYWVVKLLALFFYIYPPYFSYLYYPYQRVSMRYENFFC
jgi:hypothetical protein